MDSADNPMSLEENAEPQTRTVSLADALISV